MRLKYGEPLAYTPLVATFPCAMPSQVIALIAEYAYRSYICKKAMLTSKAGKTYLEKCKRQIAVEEVRAASVLTQFFRARLRKIQYCTTCEMWLNGSIQYRGHVRGKKHRKNIKMFGAL